MNIWKTSRRSTQHRQCALRPRPRRALFAVEHGEVADDLPDAERAQMFFAMRMIERVNGNLARFDQVHGVAVVAFVEKQLAVCETARPQLPG